LESARIVSRVLQAPERGRVDVLVGDDRKESLLNYHVSGKYVVVERTGKQYTLRGRDGDVCVYNEPALRTAAAQPARVAPPPVVTPAAASASPTASE